MDCYELACRELRMKFSQLDLNSIDIQEYSKYYLKKYLNNLEYELSLTVSIIRTAVQTSGKSIEELRLLDFGAGIGVMSLLAQVLGFNSVRYFDRDLSMRKDFDTLTEVLQVTGIESVGYVDSRELEHIFGEVDLIVSRDVIEHLYDPSDFFRDIQLFPGIRTVVHNTSANMYCLWLKSYFRQVHQKAEYEGGGDEVLKFGSTALSNFRLRYEYLRSKGVVDEQELERLAVMSRGLDYEDMDRWLKNGTPVRVLDSNTCDPVTGNWAEHLLPLQYYRSLGRIWGFDFDCTGGILDVKGGVGSKVLRHLLNVFIKLRLSGPALWPSLNLIYRR